MVSEPDIGRCANEEAELRRGWIGVPHRLEKRTCQRECWAPKGVDCEISHRFGRNKGVEISPLIFSSSSSSISPFFFSLSLSLSSSSLPEPLEQRLNNSN